MPEQQNFEQIDSIFRNAFQEMPETPAPNGWDQPSKKVWQGIESNLRPRVINRFPAQLIFLVSSAAVLSALAWYLSSKQPQVPAAVPNSIPSETVPSAPVPSVATEASEPAVMIKQNRKKGTTSERPSTSTEELPAQEIKAPTFNQALPPNSLERNRMLGNEDKKKGANTPSILDTLQH